MAPGTFFTSSPLFKARIEFFSHHFPILPQVIYSMGTSCQCIFVFSLSRLERISFHRFCLSLPYAEAKLPELSVALALTSPHSYFLKKLPICYNLKMLLFYFLDGVIVQLGIKVSTRDHFLPEFLGHCSMVF